MLNFDGGSSKPRSKDGIFTNTARIIAAFNETGQQNRFKDTKDLRVRLVLDIGKNFNEELEIEGNLNLDATDDNKKWSGAFVVRDLFIAAGVKGGLIKDANGKVNIPNEAVTGLIGKEIVTLRYSTNRNKPDGTPYYQTWNQVGSVEAGPAGLIGKFKSSLKNGYPKNYKAPGDSPAIPSPVAMPVGGNGQSSSMDF